MKFLSHLLRVGYFSVLIELINSYLLIAANLNDFRTIAEKLVPQNFVNGLSKVVSNSAIGKGSDTSNENNDYVESDNVSENNQPNLKAYEKPKVNLDIKGTKVDFDELVERVRQRLQNELKNKYIVKKQNYKETTTKFKEHEYVILTDSKSDKITSKNYVKLTSPIPETVEEEEAAYENLEYEEAVTEEPKYVPEVIIPTTKDYRYEYADSMAESETEKERHVDKKKKEKIYKDYETVTENDLYKKIDLVKKDSYEDYKIPEKENIYSKSERDHKKRFKIEKRPMSTRKTEYSYNNYVSHATISNEVRGITEDLLNDYNDTEIITDDTVIELKNKPLDTKFGTMIPKRQLYSIITPNYLNKVPNVVEKYNFNEPIPVRDQEREVTKYYGNPPASINKKVRLL